MKTRDEILAENPLVEFLESSGVHLKQVGSKLMSNRCASTEHRAGHHPVSIDAGKGVWYCNDCQCGGSVIDWMAISQGVPVNYIMRRLSGADDAPGTKSARQTPPRSSNGHSSNEPKLGKEVCAYDYTDVAGNLVFQVVRYEPKDFRQRRPAIGGGWSWKLEGVVKPLYNLPKFKDAAFIWIVEGEKDADALNRLGMVATTNAGGAKKWEEQYTEQLRDKEVILCGDNDIAGREHTKLIEETIRASARSIRSISVPLPHKDVSDYLASFEKPMEGLAILVDIASEAEPLYRGSKIPVRSMADLEKCYSEFATQSHRYSLNLAHWLPSLGRCVRPLVPGELVTLVMDTGVGKTMALQNIALTCHLPTLLFEMELPDTLTFERFCGMALRKSGQQVFNAYAGKGKLNWREKPQLENISVCTESRLTPADLERIIQGAAIKTGQRPVVVMIDYIQLLRGSTKSRYENMSLVAEELKIIAKTTETILFVASQVARKEDSEVGLHDAKDSGSIENSSGLVLSAWRDEKDKNRLMIKVCKNTKGSAGRLIPCRITDDLLIGEETKAIEADRRFTKD